MWYRNFARRRSLRCGVVPLVSSVVHSPACTRLVRRPVANWEVCSFCFLLFSLHHLFLCYCFFSFVLFFSFIIILYNSSIVVVHKGKTKYMTNYADNEDILIGQQKIEKVTEFKYLGQTTHLKDTTKEEIYARIRAGWSCFGKNKEILQDKQLPISLKKQVMDQCILPTMTYGCQTWSLNKQMTNKLRTAQRAMERKMLDLKLKDKIPCAEIRKRTKIIDIIEYTLKQKWKWAGHIARLKDNRWTRRCTEWQPRRGKRSRGRPSRRWQDDITEKEGTTWIRKATDRRRWKTLMEGYILQWMDKA